MEGGGGSEGGMDGGDRADGFGGGKGLQRWRENDHCHCEGDDPEHLIPDS